MENKADLMESNNEEDVPRYTLEAMANLALLPDDIILHIMKYLGPVELINLSKVTERMEPLASDKSLWIDIDFRPYRLKREEVLEYLHYFRKTTKLLAFRGFASVTSADEWRTCVITRDILKEINTKCPELETLILEEHYADESSVRPCILPNSLQHLSLKGCVITGLDPQRSHFEAVHTWIPHIKVLVLSDCIWVSAHDFMPISKCPNLEELRLDGCVQLGDCVAYTSLAARFGFRSLKVLDLRNTSMGDSDVVSFNRSPSLTHLYLECPTVLCEDNYVIELYDYSSEEDEYTDLQSVLGVTTSRKKKSVSSSFTKSSKKACQSNSEFCVQSRNNSCGSPSTSGGKALKQDESKNLAQGNHPQTSTSDGTFNIEINFRGSSVLYSRKRRALDSDSSDDENSGTPLSNSFFVSQSKLCKQKETKESASPSYNHIPSFSNNTSVSKINNSIQSLQNSDVGTSSDSSSSLKVNESSNTVHNSPCLNECDSSQQDGSPPHRVKFKRCEHWLLNQTANSSVSGSVYRSSNTNISPGCCRCTCKCPRFSRQIGPHRFNLPELSAPESPISDVCTRSFIASDSLREDMGYIRIVLPELVNSRPAELHTLVVRNYKTVTDKSLDYLVRLNSLRYLDISGTSVTKNGVLNFALKRPDVKIVSDYKNVMP